MRVNLENTKKFLSNKITLLMIMVCFVFCIQVFSLFKNEDESQKVNYIKKEIKNLKKDVNKIYNHYDDLGLKIDTFKAEVKKIDNSIKINNVKIENLKQYEKDTKDSFKSFTALQWEQYFADRYAQKNKRTTEAGK